MTKFNGLVIAAALGMMSALPQAASAETKVYPYKTPENYCPTGFQPVSINGVICCGKPNQNISYQSAMAHPVAKKKVHKVRHTHRKTSHARSHCEVGTKGCTFD
ncbi:hypothetical protein [Sulfitobacter sp.]|uniref:hypothetical protein n=1 Tax=Sulfitobacter sp. TaxID=1903071 RepID=UPI003002F715